MTSELDEEIQRLEARIEHLKRVEQNRREAAAAAIVPVYKYTLTKVDDKYHLLADDSCQWYSLRGEIVNKDEVVAVGKRPLEGEMRYLYNTLSGRFVTDVGGGTIFINLTSRFGHEADREAFDLLELFIHSNPDGGDVTHIVSQFHPKEVTHG